MLPPFYYKGVSDEGLYRAFATVIDKVADERLRVYLYHIPPVSQIPISRVLIERLFDRFPGSVAGIKDSSNDWANAKMVIDEFGPRGFNVFAGSESYLLRTLRAGGSGCITATANVNPAPKSICIAPGRMPMPTSRTLKESLDRIHPDMPGAAELP